MIRTLSLFALACFAANAFAAPCDRACLTAALDQYLAALVKHDPAAAPLGLGFRQTENAVVVLPGTGLWQSATALGTLQRRYFDATTEQAAYFGTLNEADGPAIVNLRLKVEDRKIMEAEWVVNRKGDPGLGPLGGGQASNAFYDPDYLLAHAPAQRVVPKAERHTRSQLVAIANSYFDGLSAHNGKIIMAHPGCVRIENGSLTTQRPIAAGGQTDCTAEGPMTNIFAVTARRYPVVDEEAGAVLALALFQRKPGVDMRRNLLAEWFFVDAGKIRTVYAAMYYPDANAMAPNWPPFDGNWPVVSGAAR
ncbi:MAG TPA: hypothetical protein VFX89_15800 [Gammaproteobacteria bacterium]|nr:hypothetical protein [Gammaproteobacteria bacterium]